MRERECVVVFDKTLVNQVPDLGGSLDAARIQKEAGRALELRTEWYEALGIPTEQQPQGPLSFEPWLERARWERVVAIPNLNPEQQEHIMGLFRQEVVFQLTTALKERYSCETSTIAYPIVNGKLRSSLLPDENFEDVLLRGQEYRKQSGSKDLSREEQEIVGFNKIQKIACDPETSLGTRIISCSPPSQIEGTPYAKKFVDIWEVKENTQGERYAEVTRFAAGLDLDGYKRSVKNLNPAYFEDKQALATMPVDAYFLSHPIPLPVVGQYGTVDKLYEAFFERDYKAMKQVLFEQIKTVCMPFIQVFVSRLCQTNVDWVSVAESFNATLNIGDKFLTDYELNALKSFITKESEAVYTNNMPVRVFSSMDEQIRFWGRQQVRVVGGGCGPSAGFGIGSGLGLGSFGLSFSNSAASFGLTSVSESDRYGSLEFECPKCKRVNRRTHNQLQSNCQHCGVNVKC